MVRVMPLATPMQALKSLGIVLGRVQTIQHEPTEEKGLKVSMIAEMEEKMKILYEDILKNIDDPNPGKYVFHN